MKNTIFRYVLCAMVAVLLFAGLSVSPAVQEEQEQISMCFLDFVEVSD